MSPRNRGNPALAKKIATMKLEVLPIFQLPEGPPHPAFPKNLMAYHLLTEDELDDMAHYYHQSTPGFYTLQYPKTMNWDKLFLSRRLARRSSLPDIFNSANATKKRSCESDDEGSPTKKRRFNVDVDEKVDTFLNNALPTHVDPQQLYLPGDEPRPMSSVERIKIKRRKFGKFIGLPGTETPVEEIDMRIDFLLARTAWLRRQTYENSQRKL